MYVVGNETCLEHVYFICSSNRRLGCVGCCNGCVAYDNTDA